MTGNKRWRKALPALLLCAVAAAVAVIGGVYVRFISRSIYEDSTDHLREIYGQVNRSFGTFVEQNWGMLAGWGEHFLLVADQPEQVTTDYVRQEQKRWGFSQFYFLGAGDTALDLDGNAATMALGGARADLARGGEPVMASETLPDRQAVTVFAVPVRGGEFRGYPYTAIAVSYTNADMAASLNVDAFGGKAKCFVIHDDGTVLLSTQSGGSIFENYLVYLKAASDLKDADLAAIGADWQAGREGLRRCRIGGADQCILYQPVGYQDYILLSVVPQNVLSAGFVAVQQTTMYMLIAVFAIVGTAVVVLLLVRGRAESRRSRLELQSRDAMFDVLSNSVDDIFLMLDAGTQTVDYISPNIERLLGIPAANARADLRVLEKCAMNEAGVVIPQAELAAIPLGGSAAREYEYRHQSTGERRWYRMTVYHMRIQETVKYIFVLSDRTLDEQMNQKLQEALDAARTANEAKSNFLSNMSHDIRTPMNAIVGLAALLEEDAGDPERVRDYTHKVMASSRHLLSLINDVLDMSKIESGKTSLNIDRFTLPELLEELDVILRPQANAKNQEFITTVVGTPPPPLLGDKLRLNQILINLLSNAIKYTPEGGCIEFSIDTLPAPAPQYTKLRFTVRDNGIGMSEEFQKQVFDPFCREINSVTNKVQGTGLGMAITKNLVDLMGGIITVKSAPGLGSTFTVEMAFAQAAAESETGPAAAPAPAAPAQDALKGLHFLVAEDNELNAEILTELLAGEGAECELAADGEQAVAMFEASAPGRYDMILMDVQMPKMNGYEATRRIRAGAHPAARTVPIAAMTANTFAEDVRNALDAGMDGHLGKPIDMDAVRALVSRLVKKPEAKPETGTETAPEPERNEAR